MENSLLKAFNKTKIHVNGHGRRTVQVLKDAFSGLADELESEMYGKGELIESFQEKIAAYLGKESAVFFPSGTMAQQIALRIWSDERGIKKVAYHPLSHLEIREEDGLKELHHIQTILLADESRVIEFEDVVGVEEDISCLLLELPQRDIGGQLPAYETLEKISKYCKDKGIKLHMDGARLFEILPFYQKTAREISDLFDSVYVSFYKGIGGIAGAILAGDNEFIEKSKIWKKRHGGDLISLYPYYLSADYYFEKRKNKMEQYYQGALELASYYNNYQKVSTIPAVPVSNMFHVHFKQPKETMERILTDISLETGIGLTSYIREVNETSSYFEVSIGDLYSQVPKAELEKTFELLNKKLSEQVDNSHVTSES